MDSLSPHRGGSRIPRRRGRQQSSGVPTYEFAKFSEKLHEIEKILGSMVGGGGRRVRPPSKSTNGTHRLQPVALMVIRGLHFQLEFQEISYSWYLRTGVQTFMRGVLGFTLLAITYKQV